MPAFWIFLFLATFLTHFFLFSPSAYPFLFKWRYYLYTERSDGKNSSVLLLHVSVTSLPNSLRPGMF